MALDHIPLHTCGVARAQFQGHAKRGAGGSVAFVDARHLKPCGLQVGHPVFAAPTVGVFPDLDQRQGLCSTGRQAPSGTQSQGAEAHGQGTPAVQGGGGNGGLCSGHGGLLGVY